MASSKSPLPSNGRGSDVPLPSDDFGSKSPLPLAGEGGRRPGEGSAPKSHSLWLGWLIFALGALFYSYEYLLRILPGTMTDALMQWHGLNPEQLGWFASSYYLTYTLMQLPVGLLLDRFNPKYVLLAAMMACLLGNNAFGVNNVAIAVIGRILVGLGSAFAFVGVLRLATLWLPRSQFALATGLVTTVGMLGGMVGDVGLSPLVVKLGPESAIHMASLLGLPILLALMFIPAKSRMAAIDRRDTAVPCPSHREAMSTVFASTAKQSSYDKNEAMPSVIATTFADLTQGLLSVAKQPWLWINALIGCLLYIPLSAFAELWGIPFLESTQHIDPVTAGDAMSWLLLGWAVGAPLIGYIVDIYRRPLLVLMIGSGLALLAILTLLYAKFASHGSLDLMLFLFGAASTGQILVMVLAKSAVPVSQQATAMAFTNMLIMLGGMIFQPLIGTILKMQGTLVDGTIVYSASAYEHAMLIVPAALLFGMLLISMLKHLRHPQTPTESLLSASDSV